MSIISPRDMNDRYAETLYEAVQMARECGFPVAISPIWCGNGVTQTTIVSSPREMMVKARDVFNKSEIGQIRISPLYETKS